MSNTTNSVTPVRDTWIEFLEPIPWAFAGHYTFKYATSEERGIQLFTNYADRHLGGLFGRPIPWVAVPELTHAGRVHFHALFVGVGHDRAHRVEAERHVLERRWRYGRRLVKKVYYPLGALGYMLKLAEEDDRQPFMSRALREQLHLNQLNPLVRVN